MLIHGRPAWCTRELGALGIAALGLHSNSRQTGGRPGDHPDARADRSARRDHNLDWLEEARRLRTRGLYCL